MRKWNNKIVVALLIVIVLAMAAVWLKYFFGRQEVGREVGINQPVVADHLDVSGCILLPAFMKVLVSQPIVKIVNDSFNQVDLAINTKLSAVPGSNYLPKVKLSIRPKSSDNLLMQFSDGIGSYAYTCSSNGKSASGLFAATSQ